MSSETGDRSSEVGPIIRVSGVSKMYEVYKKPADRLLQALVGKYRKFYEEFWALREIDLEVPRGETLGVVGRNGAGKTTLLQCIAGTLGPTSGAIEVNGRVTALLELGSGFNPEMSGRQNVITNAMLHGVSRAEILERLGAIREFAGLGEFFERPVKTYSKGMYARLGFSVLANLDPDVFIVDEALSVGDAVFRHRCMLRIEQMKERGTTILYVSHDAASMKRWCDEVVWLRDGRVEERGDPARVTKAYLDHIFGVVKSVGMSTNVGASDAVEEASDNFGLGPDASEDRENGSSPSVPQPPDAAGGGLVSPASADADPWTALGAERDVPGGDDRSGDGRALILGVGLYREDGRPCGMASPGDTVVLRVTYQNVSLDPDAEQWRMGYVLRSPSGIEVAGSNTDWEGLELRPPAAGEITTLRWSIVLPRLRNGDYAITVGVAGFSDKIRRADRIDNAVVFRVAAPEQNHFVLRLDSTVVAESSATV